MRIVVTDLTFVIESQYGVYTNPPLKDINIHHVGKIIKDQVTSHMEVDKVHEVTVACKFRNSHKPLDWKEYWMIAREFVVIQCESDQDLVFTLYTSSARVVDDVVYSIVSLLPRDLEHLKMDLRIVRQ
jgi:hypothetical protein